MVKNERETTICLQYCKPTECTIQKYFLEEYLLPSIDGKVSLFLLFVKKRHFCMATMAKKKDGRLMTLGFRAQLSPFFLCPEC